MNNQIVKDDKGEDYIFPFCKYRVYLKFTL